MGFGPDPWWTVLLPVLFSAPWIAGIIWVYLRRGRDGGELPPSMATMARRRLWTP